MINDKALAQTKSLSTQSLTTNYRGTPAAWRSPATRATWSATRASPTCRTAHEPAAGGPGRHRGQALKKQAPSCWKDRLATTTAAGMKKVYSDDGSEFKREFKELMDFWDIEKQVTRGHAYFAERAITIKEAMLRRVAAGAGWRCGTSCCPTS